MWGWWTFHLAFHIILICVHQTFISVNDDRLPKWQECCARTLAAAAAKSFQSCPTLHDPIDGSPPGSPIPGIPGKNTGVGCHFLLQCMKVKSESEVAQSHLILRDPMDCSPPDSSVHGIFQARALEWGAISFSTLALIFMLQLKCDVNLFQIYV